MPVGTCSGECDAHRYTACTCGVADPGLDCLGIFRGSTGNVGGNNVYFNGMQSHVEVATSAESFAAYERDFAPKLRAEGLDSMPRQLAERVGLVRRAG